MNFLKKYRHQEHSLPFTPPPEEITLPPNGTYPPRLLVMPRSADTSIGYWSIAMWLHDGKTIDVLPKKLSVQSLNGYCVLTKIQEFKEKVLLNGQPFENMHTLKDGDFVQVGSNWRAIFQADPVKDRRLMWFPEHEAPLLEDENIEDDFEPTFSELLLENVVVNREGVSFNKGKDFAQWDEIAYLWFSVENEKYTHKIIVSHDGKEVTLNSNLTKLNLDEHIALCIWLGKAAPFNLTMWNWIGYNFAEIFPDAYYDAIVQKIYVPHERGEHDLPATVEFLFGIPSKRERLIKSIGLLSMLPIFLVIVSLCMASMGDKGSFGERFVRIFIIWGCLFGVISIFYSLIWLDAWLKARAAK